MPSDDVQQVKPKRTKALRNGLTVLEQTKARFLGAGGETREAVEKNYSSSSNMKTNHKEKYSGR